MSSEGLLTILRSVQSLLVTGPQRTLDVPGGLQKTLGVAQQARIGQRELAKQEGLPEPIQKFVEDPLNELEYAGKSALSFLGNALRMGSEAGY